MIRNVEKEDIPNGNADNEEEDGDDDGEEEGGEACKSWNS
jgi:hypothetical protein